MSNGNEKLIKAIKSVLILDDDEVARNLIANHFERMGITNVQTVENAVDALEACKERRFDFIVSDWKLQGMSGLAFFNRLRNLPEYRTIPLMVVSGFVDKDDFRLLQEFPCTSLVEKPFTRVIFQKCVESLVAESTWYGQNSTLIDAVLEAVKYDGDKAELLIREITKKAPNPIPVVILAAKRLVKNDMLNPARKILELIVEKDDRCVPALSELGKILHMQGEHQRALDYLRAASKLSPHNIRRLCLLGEVELNLNDVEAARIFFAKALVADPDESTALAGMVVADNMSEFVPVSTAKEISRNFASLMNTLGITMVRNGQFSKGIEQYQSAMYFLQKNEDNAKVAFNLGLGFLRWGKPKDALPWFKKSEQLVGNNGKSTGYVQMLLQKMGLPYMPPDSPKGDVSNFDLVNRPGVQDKWSFSEDNSIDTASFKKPSLHVAETKYDDGLDEHVGNSTSGDFPEGLNDVDLLGGFSELADDILDSIEEAS